MTAQPNDADRHPHFNPDPEATGTAQRPGLPRSGQETTRPVPDQPPIRPNRQANRQAGRQTGHQPDRLSTGQSARLARREAIRAQRQAVRRAGQQAGPGAPRTAKAQPLDARASQPLAFKSPSAKSHSPSPGSTAVHPFRPKQSLWLTLLVWLQRGSGVVTLMLVVGALITYGWTVYTQEQWGKQFDKLESLKKKERQLVSANEVLKNQMAEQAERPTAGLLLPDPSNAIFLAPAPQRPPVKPRPVTPGAKPDPIRVLGY